MWCYFCSNSNTRKVEALGGHLFVRGQVGDVDIEKKTIQNFGLVKTHVCLKFELNRMKNKSTLLTFCEMAWTNGQPLICQRCSLLLAERGQKENCSQHSFLLRSNSRRFDKNIISKGGFEKFF